MSYIRALSNPERLYIFGGPEGVEIYYHPDQGSDSLVVPHSLFARAMRAILNHEEQFKYGDIQVREIMDLPFEHPDTFKWELSYKEHKIVAFYTTWHYVAHNFIRKLG